MDNPAITKITDSIANGIEALATKIENIAPKVWDIMVRQQKIEASICLILYCLLFVGSCFAIYNFKKNISKLKVDQEYAKKHGLKYDEDPIIFCYIGIVVLIIINIIFLSFGCSEWLNQLLNPEYYAIKELVRMVK